MTETKKVEKKMGLLSLIGMLLAGIVVVDTFAIPAAMGYSALGLWLLVAVLFMIPNGFINAELGSRDGNGLVSWIKKTLGEKHATVMGFFYWINVALWMPAVFIVFVFWTMEAVQAEIHIGLQIFIGLAANWIIVFIVRRGVGMMEIINNISAIIKILLLVTLGILGVVFISKNGTGGTGFKVGNFFPSLSDIASIGFVSAIVFNLLGFELISAVGDKVKNPKKNIPLAVIIGALVIGGIYIFGTIGVLANESAALEDDLFLETALPLTLIYLITELGGEVWMAQVLIFLALFALATSMIAWISGASEILEDLDFAKNYKTLSDRHPKYDTLSKGYILLGAISSVFIVAGLSMEQWGDGGAFWTILALSMVVFIIPYLYLTPAIIIYRKRNEGGDESYKIPGGNIVIYLFAFLNFFFVGLAVIMLFVESAGDPILYYTIISVGTVVCAGIGYWLYWDSQRKLSKTTK